MKDKYKILEEIKSIDRHYQEQIKHKETLIKVLEAEIEMTYEVINNIQRIGELVNLSIESERTLAVDKGE